MDKPFSTSALTLVSIPCFAAEQVGPAGRVVAFEPLPRNLAYLRKHVELNKLGNVDIVEMAVSDGAGTATFDTAGDSYTGRLSNGGTLSVGTVSLDELVEAGAASVPDVIKIDVEGAEAAVLSGAQRLLRRSRPVVFLATHGDAVRDRCWAKLRELDYRLTPIDAMEIADAFELIAEPNVTDG